LARLVHRTYLDAVAVGQLFSSQVDFPEREVRELFQEGGGQQN
jgi:hypothetical protein